MKNRVIPLEVKGTVRTNINGKRRRTVEEHEKYVDMRNACHRRRCEKNKTISYFTGFDDGFEQAKKQLAEQIEKMKNYLPVDERDSDHKWFAYKNLFDTEWKIDYSVSGGLPKCNTIKWFESKEAVMYYLVTNGMFYRERDIDKE